jgi:uncharacterized protein (TIGR02246 family)
VRTHACLAVFLATLLSSCASTGGGADSAAREREQVASAVAAWVAAYDSRDPARITAQYAPDAVFWGTSSKTVRTTPAQIAEYFKDAAARPDARASVGEQHIRIYGDVAIATGYNTFSNIRDGKRVTNPARFSAVFHKRDGKWVLVDHHSSRLP